jgi:hypothetical protein
VQGRTQDTYAGGGYGEVQARSMERRDSKTRMWTCAESKGDGMKANYYPDSEVSINE